MDGKRISDIEFFPHQTENGKIEWFANIYFKKSTPPITVSQNEAVEYLEAMAIANDIDPSERTALAQLQENGLFAKVPEEAAMQRFSETLEEKKGKVKKGVSKKLLLKGIAITLAVGTALGLLAKGCSLNKKSKYDNNNTISDQNIRGTFAELVAKLQAGPKKDAVIAVQSTLKNFNDTLSGSIMREGEDKRLAHSWDENVAAYLAFNTFTDEELFQIFDTYQLDGNYLYDQLKLGNMKEMLYYARATQPSGRADLIKTEEGKQFFTKYENKVLEFNKATTKEDKIAIAKDFYAMARADFPIQDEDKEGFIHTEKGYEDYSYAVTPMIAAMEVMTRNVGVSLSDKEVDYFNELGMCNFAEEKLQNYQASLTSRQNVEVAKEELRAEYQVETDEEGKVQVVETVRYEDLREAGIASIEHYDLSEEKNDVGTIPGYWEDATLDTAKKQQIINGGGSSGGSSVSTETYHKTLTEEEVKKESPAIQKEAEKQKEAIEQKFEEQNKQAKEESDKKKAELEKEIEEEKQQLEQEIEEDNAWMHDDDTKVDTGSSNGDSSSSSGNSDEVPARPSIDDVDDHITIDDDYVDEDGNLEFDGPIYDKDGNIIDNPSAKAEAKKQSTSTTTTYSGTSFVQRSSGLYVPSSVEEVNSYVDQLADQSTAVNQQTNSSGITK